MSGTGTGRRADEGFVGLAKSIQGLQETSRPSRLHTRREAARRLGITMRELSALLFLGRLTRVKVLGRERIYLP